MTLPTTVARPRTITAGIIAIHTVYYEGNGPELLLIHGISSNGGGWDPVIDDLSQHFSPITVDLRGHGHSDKPDSGYLYDDYISDLEHLLIEMDMEHPLIMGHSLGGIITLWWAARHPSQAKALVIEDSPLRSGEDFRPAFEEWLRLNAMPYDELVRLNRAEHPEWPEDMAASRAHAMSVTKRAVFKELMADSMNNHDVDRIAEIEGIGSPVLLVHGDYQTGGMVHPDDVDGLQRRLANARTVRIPGGSHTLHRSSKEAFLAAAVPFLLEHAD